MGARYVRAMDWIYWFCIAVGVFSVVAMTGLIGTGVFLRYVFNYGAQFAEPMAIFFAIQLTFYGAAACLRAGVHLRLAVFVNLLPPPWPDRVDRAIHVILAGFALFMIVWGISLSQTTWFQSYPEFQYVKVGLVYTAIPGAGVITFLFVLETLFFHAEHVEHQRVYSPDEHDTDQDREELESVLGR